jgi:threonine/homoserine/homoserine lactone efflux protein
VIFARAFLIATSLEGYLAAFSAFVQPDVPVAQQMRAIVPTALTLTALRYTAYTAIGAGLGRLAIGALMNVWLRRGMAALFVAYGVALGTTATRA